MISLINRFRSILLHPNSRLELWLRTIYHKLNATRFIFTLHHFAALRSYKKWRSSALELPAVKLDRFTHQPKVTFILNHRVDIGQQITKTLESLLDLNGDNWEVLLFSLEDAHKTDIPKHLNQDSHIKIVPQNRQIDTLSTVGDYVIFCQPGDHFFNTLLSALYEQIENGASADVFYYDCEFDDDTVRPPYPLFKPSKVSPTLLLSINYLSRAFIHRSALASVLPSIETKSSLPAQEYNIIFKLYEKRAAFQHIPAVLVSQLNRHESKTPEMRRTVLAHLSRLGLENTGVIETSSGSRFTWHSGHPTTAIIIPSKNNYLLLETLIDSIFKHTNNSDFSILIVDNGSQDPSTLDYYKTIRKNPIIRIIDYDAPFNYSEAINLGVEKSSSDLVLFLNDDMEVINDAWLKELTQWATRPEIGVAGAKLLRANRSIQHAGIIIGLNGFAGHIYSNAPNHYNGLFGSTDWYRDYLAVTGACQMMRREVFNKAGGYDEGYQLAFGDIDFCLRVEQLGYRNIYTPFSNLFHFEGQSRGYQTPTKDVLKGLEDMESYIKAGDPNYSPNLTYTRIPKCALKKKSLDARAEQIEIRKNFFQKK